MLHKSRQKQLEVLGGLFTPSGEIETWQQIKHETKTTSSSDLVIHIKMIGNLRTAD